MERPCPECSGPAKMDKDNKYRPFCSERCQLLDLGRWLGEEYVVSRPFFDEALGREVSPGDRSEW